MTIKDIEKYINTNLRTLPEDGHNWIVSYVFVFGTNQVNLVRLIPNSEGKTNYISPFSNYACFETITLSNGVTYEQIANVDFLFPATSGTPLRSNYGCNSFLHASNQDVISWEFHPINTGFYGVNDEGYQLFLNDVEWHEFYIQRRRESPYYFEPWGLEHIGGDYNAFPNFTDPLEAKAEYERILIAHLQNAEGKFSGYYPFLKNYLTCLNNRVDKCCLEYC